MIPSKKDNLFFKPKFIAALPKCLNYILHLIFSLWVSRTFTSTHINLILLYIIKMTLTDINLFYACNFSYTSLASVLRKNSPSKCSAMLFIQNRIRGEVIDHIEIYESAKSKTVNGLDIHTQ